MATHGFREAHFATYPPELVRRPILATCPEVVCLLCGQGKKLLARAMPCECQAPVRPGMVLDPFFGSGTTGLVARQLGRDFLGIELNPEYVRLAQRRLGLPTSESQEAA